MQSVARVAVTRLWHRHLLLAALAAVATPTTQAEEAPAPLQALSERGARVGEAFDAPGGMTGYTITLRGRTMAVYVTEDGEHAVVGTLFDADGNNLSRKRIAEAASKPQAENVWSRLTDSRWIADGSEDAERVIYVFTDPNCPYCHGFWQAARPWVDAGAVQLRHVMVGVIKQDSVAKAATLLAADDPSGALTEHERTQSTGGVHPLDDLPASARTEVERNNRLMHDMGYYATPTIIYRNEEGRIRQKQGQPRGETLTRIMGGPAPQQ